VDLGKISYFFSARLSSDHLELRFPEQATLRNELIPSAVKGLSLLKTAVFYPDSELSVTVAIAWRFN
jgi:hypothetical protein